MPDSGAGGRRRFHKESELSADAAGLLDDAADRVGGEDDVAGLDGVANRLKPDFPGAATLYSLVGIRGQIERRAKPVDDAVDGADADGLLQSIAPALQLPRGEQCHRLIPQRDGRMPAHPCDIGGIAAADFQIGGVVVERRGHRDRPVVINFVARFTAGKQSGAGLRLPKVEYGFAIGVFEVVGIGKNL